MLHRLACQSFRANRSCGFRLERSRPLGSSSRALISIRTPGPPNIRMRLKSLAHMPRPHRSEWSGEAISRIGGEKQLPDVAVLLDLLLEWASDERTRQRILVDNPQALYGFDPA